MLQDFLADYSISQFYLTQMTQMDLNLRHRKTRKIRISADIFDYFESLDVINNYQVRRNLPQVLDSKFLIIQVVFEKMHENSIWLTVSVLTICASVPDDVFLCQLMS